MKKKPVEETLIGTLPKGAQEHFTKHKIKMSRKPSKTGKKKYAKPPKFLSLNEGYDILENLLVVRKYVSKKYGIDWKLLEILLFLYPKNYFTWDDYYEMPKDFRYMRLSKLEQLGVARILSRERTLKGSLYTLTTKSRNIVTVFYEYLSGEKKIPEMNNPLNLAEGTAIDKIRFNLIKKINAAPVSENKKRLFT